MPIPNNLGNQQPQFNNQINFSDISFKKENKHGKHKNPNYHREYYQNNREKLLVYGHDYYGVKKLLENCLKVEKKGTKIGVKKNFLTDARNINLHMKKTKIKSLFKKNRKSNKRQSNIPVTIELYRFLGAMLMKRKNTNLSSWSNFPSLRMF